jgi:hypothetical protein
MIVGSHDPALSLSLTGPVGGTDENGTNEYAYPYHSVKTDAEQLLAEIDLSAGSAVAVSVTKYTKLTAGVEVYDGSSGTPFALVPGEGYRVKVSADTSYTPSHY